jgi:L-2-hydroxyglutarate oxidase LhgO
MTAIRVGVVGAGILGLAIARRLTELLPDANIIVLDKEDRIAAHQTGHNSGVAHAGLYYQPGSLKAQLCRRGIGLLKDYCRDRQLPYDECGKLVIARTEDEVGRLRAIHDRATANGVPGLSWLGPDALKDIEPYAVGVAALRSPTTAIVDFAAVARAFAEDVRAAGGTIRLSHEVVGIRRRGDAVQVAVRGSGGTSVLTFDRLVVCAGLQSDRVARLAGDTPEPVIVPFRGEYYRLIPQREYLVRGLIYPVPDPQYPFLGVHFTRRVRGGVDVGPNAVLALAREGYQRRDVHLADVAELLRWPGGAPLVRRHWRTGLKELYGSLSRRAFVAEAATFVPALQISDVTPAPAGVRAQAVDADGKLVDDFRIGHLGTVVTLRNAPSPGATSALAIAEYVTNQVLVTAP